MFTRAKWREKKLFQVSSRNNNVFPPARAKFNKVFAKFIRTWAGKKLFSKFSPTFFCLSKFIFSFSSRGVHSLDDLSLGVWSSFKIFLINSRGETRWGRYKQELWSTYHFYEITLKNPWCHVWLYVNALWDRPRRNTTRMQNLPKQLLPSTFTHFVI